eukprot:gene8372-9270_t
MPLLRFFPPIKLSEGKRGRERLPSLTAVEGPAPAGLLVQMQQAAFSAERERILELHLHHTVALGSNIAVIKPPPCQGKQPTSSMEETVLAPDEEQEFSECVNCHAQIAVQEMRMHGNSCPGGSSNASQELSMETFCTDSDNTSSINRSWNEELISVFPNVTEVKIIEACKKSDSLEEAVEIFPNKQLTPDAFINLVTTEIRTAFGDRQSYDWFMQFIQDSKEKRLHGLLQFITGFKNVPPLVLPHKICLKYLSEEDESASLPTSMACLCILSLPTVPSFEESLILAIDCESQGFGSVQTKNRNT